MREQQQLKTNSKYVKKKREIQTLEGASVFFIVSLFVLPQYFGIQLPIFDFTILRIAIVALLLVVFTDINLKNKFFSTIKEASFSVPAIVYLLVTVYTMVFRTDLNAFLNPFIEILSLYLLILCIKESLGFEKTYKCFCHCVYLLLVLGIIEYFMGRSPFSYLVTIKGIYTGVFVRSGNYRIMSSAAHSLGYGLMLISFAPFVCYNEKRKCVDLFAKPLFTILWILNVFLTGSRSTLGVLAMEIIAIIIFSERKARQKSFLLIIIFATLLVAFLIPFHNTSFGSYIMLQITSMIDQVFGTTYSVKYGADIAILGSSSNYRAQLKYIYSVDWLNPILGIGRSRSFSANINGSYIRSVDDFYAAEFIRYAYPGLFSYVIFVLVVFIRAVRKAIKEKSQLATIFAIGIAFYMLNLKWVDSLQTLKYLYVIFALVETLPVAIDKKEETVPKKKSKYIKREA